MSKNTHHTNNYAHTRQRAVPFFVCILTLLSFFTPRPVSALPTGFQEYYVLGYEEHAWRAFLAINDDPDPDRLHDGKICSTIGLVATADHQIVYYDHWEDGYEPDLPNPVQDTTQVFALNTGDTISLSSDQNFTDTIDGYVPVNPERDPNDLRYDGGDRIITSGGPVNLTHAMWPYDDSWIGGAWEVYSRQTYANAYSYHLPIGEDLYTFGGGNNGTYGDFRNVYLELGAFEDNTTVSIDNGTSVTNLTLDRGQAYSSMGYINSSTAPTITLTTGTVIHTSKPVQVGLMTGADGSFQGRFLILLPDRLWGADYVVPVPNGAPAQGQDAEIYISNPNDFEITINAYDAETHTSFTISPTGYISATIPYSQKRGQAANIPQDSAARFTSADGVFGVIICAGTSDSGYDWGFTGIPAKHLSQDYYAPWSPGNTCVPPIDPVCLEPPIATNGSPIWVTPLTDNTTFHVDFGPVDGVEDTTFTLDVLQQRRIFDDDKNNTGMHIWATDKFAMAWGEDPATADLNPPFLDLGFSVLPPIQQWLDPVLTLDKTVAPTILPPAGGIVTFTLIAQGYSAPLTHVNISDTLPINWAFVPGSTHVTYPDHSTANPEPTIQGQNIFWNLSANLGIDQSLTLTFQAQITDTNGISSSVNQSEAIGKHGYSGALFNPRDEATVYISFLDLVKSVSSAETAISSTLVYTLSYANVSDSTTATNVLLSDVVPIQHVTFQPAPSGTVYSPTSGVVSWKIPSLAPLSSDTVNFTVTVNNFVEHGTAIQNVSHIDSDQTPKASSNTVHTTVLAPDVTLDKSATHAALFGQPITYTLSYENIGGAQATRVTIWDTIPTATSYISNSLAINLGNGWVSLTGSQRATFISPTLTITPGVTPGSIAAGETGQIRFSVQITGDLPLGSRITNWATLDRDLDNPRDSNMTVTYISDLLINKTVDTSVNSANWQPTTVPGGLITYTLRYANASSTIPQTGVYLRESIPDHTHFITASGIVSYSWNHGIDWSNTPSLTETITHIRWHDPSLPASTKRTVNFTVQVSDSVPASTTLQNIAHITSTETGGYLNEWTASNPVEVKTVDLSIQQSASQASAQAGDMLSYTIYYTNQGSVDGLGVQILDTIPISSTYVTDSIWGAGADSGGNPALTWNLTATAGDSAQAVGYAVTINGDILPGSNVVNTAILSGAYRLYTSNPLTIPIIYSANLSMTQFSNHTTVDIGQTLTYTIIVSNTGTGYAAKVTISNTLAANTQLVADSITLDPPGNGATGTTPPTLASDVIIAPGQHITVTFAVTVLAPLPDGTAITNTTYITSPHEPAPLKSIITTLVQSPILTLTKQSGSKWAKRVKLTFDNTAQTENLLNFAVLVVLNNSRIDYAHTQNGGQDIRFIDPDGTILAHEIEQWDESGDSYVWVRVPQIDANSADDHIWMYYSNPDAVDGQKPETAWDAAYKGVWHLAETVTDEQTNGTHADSTSNHNDGSQNGNDDTTGSIAHGQNFDGTDDYIRIAGLLETPADITISAWANLDTPGSNGSEIISLGDYAAVRLDESNNTKGFFYNGSGWSNTSYLQAHAGTGWHYFAYTYDDAGDSQKLYVDGVERAATNHTDFIVYTGLSSTNTFIGTHGNTKSHFDFTGDIDEVRVSDVVRSAGWIRAQYASMTDAFITFGSERDIDPPNRLAIAGIPLTYTITVTNTGHGAATHIVVTDTLPDGANHISGGSFISASNTVSWTIMSIPSNNNSQATFTVTTCQLSLLNAAYRAITSTQKVDSAPGPPLLTLLAPPSINASFDHTPLPITLGDTVYFTSTSTSDGSPLTDWAWDFGDTYTATGPTANHTYPALGIYTATLTVTDACGYAGATSKIMSTTTNADLSIAKSASPNPVEISATLTYTLTYANAGPTVAQNVHITDTLPPGVTYSSIVSVTPPLFGPTPTLPHLAWYTPTLAAGGSGAIIFTVTVNNDAGQTLTNNAVITAASADHDPGNNTAAKATDVAPRVDFDSAAYTVGESDGTATITVTLSYPTNHTATVDYQTTTGGTAAPGTDYTATGGTLTFAPHTTIRTFTVSIVDDQIDEADETIILSLMAGNNATTGDANNPATLTIGDDDDLPVADFGAATFSVGESDGAASITVTLGHLSSFTVTVDYDTLDGTAAASADYTAISGTLYFGPLSAAQSFTVPITPDQINELDETVVLSLTGATNATVGDANNPATLTIGDDDDLPVADFGAATFSVGESDGAASITVTLGHLSSFTVTVDYDTLDGTAAASADYTAISGTLYFGPLSAAQSFAVPITPDQINELDETIVLSLTGAASATVGAVNNPAILTIHDDDALPIADFGTPTPSVSEGDGAASIVVALNYPSIFTITVDYSTFAGTATASKDYTATNGTLNFGPLSTTQSFTIPIIQDIIDEPDETVILSLTGATSGTIGTTNNPAKLTIYDDDGPTIIQGTVFSDTNGNGVQNTNEPGIPNVAITLNPITSTAIVTTTNASGDYSFTLAMTGTHTVVEVDPYAPGSFDAAPMDPQKRYFSTTPNEIHVHANPGRVYQINFGDALPTASFSSIHGNVFEDLDGNGIQDKAELGIPGIPVTLDGDTTATSNLYGSYTLSGTVAVHTAVETQPDGYFSTTPDEVHVKVQKPGKAYPVNFGDAPAGSGFAVIYGTVFYDAIPNGTFGPREPGIFGVAITANKDETVTTNSYGNYTLSTITTTGTYTITETDPGNYYTSTTPNEITRAVLLNTSYQIDFGDRQLCIQNPDSYEPDDEPADAKFLVRSIHNFCDDATDWVRFTTKASTVYTIHIFSQEQWADTTLDLYAPGNFSQTLASSNDGEATNDFPRIVWQAPGNETYYVHVSNRDAVTGADTGYDLWIIPPGSPHIYLPLVMRNS